MIKITATIEDYKKMFFRDDFARKLASSNQRSLSLFGRNVRRSAQRRIKNARRMPLGSMSPEQRRAYKNAQRRGAATSRQFQASKPGEAPRNRTGKLKKNIFYGLEGSGNVVIGPAFFPTVENYGAEKLEKGGRIGRKKRRPVVRKIGDGAEIRVHGAREFNLDRDKKGRLKRARHWQTGSTHRTVREVRPGVFVAYMKIRTQAQADRANDLHDQLYGAEERSLGDSAFLLPRPYMQPSFNETMVEIPRIFADSIR